MNGIEEIKAVVKGHTFPPFIHDVKVHLSEYDGDPAVMLTFLTDRVTGMDVPAQMARGEALARFTNEVFVDLMERSVGPFPYFRFEDADAVS